jgi:hypothetical protein
MVDPDKRMVFHMGHPIPTLVDASTPTTFSGIIGYTVAIASHVTARESIILQRDRHTD